MTPRVASLLPAATEIAFAVGAGAEVVGVSHACDHPREATRIPALTRPRLTARAGAGEVDRALRDSVALGADLFEVDVGLLRGAAPDVVLAQDVCAVCAVSRDAAEAALARADVRATVVVLRAGSLSGVARDILQIGAALGRDRSAGAVAGEFERRLARIARRTRALPKRRVVALEWLDPPFVAGHWVPEMVRIAGGEEALGSAGARSRATDWATVERAKPEALCIVPCGRGVAAGRREWSRARRALAARGSPLARLPALVLDAAGLVSRPGPRLARGVEVLAALLHPTRGLAVPSRAEGLRA